MTVDPDLLAWVRARTGNGRKFASISHAVDRGFRLLQLEEEGRVHVDDEQEAG